MPVYQLGRRLVFPPADHADETGLLAVGGDFGADRLALAYASGIFPWPNEHYPHLWFSPDPRFVLPLSEVHVPRSLRKTIRREPFEVRFDTRFAEVMRACARAPRPGQSGTWITGELLEGYVALHARGLAHSIEAYEGDVLVGGLYGVSLGRAFFGESMFARRSDASKVVFTTLLGHLAHWGFDFVDCQVETEHLARFGADSWPRARYLSALAFALTGETRVGPWRTEATPVMALHWLDARRAGDASQPGTF